MCEYCRQLLESMFVWLVPPMLRVATRLVRAPVPMQDLNLVASCMRLLDALLVPEFRDSPQLIAEMNDNVQMVSQHLSPRLLLSTQDPFTCDFARSARAICITA